MEKRNKKFIFHIGCHKTATTHLQNTLFMMREQLLCRDIYYDQLSSIREKILLINSPRSTQSYSRYLPRRLSAKIYKNILSDDKYSVYLASEENILGKPSELIAEDIYPRMHRRISFLRDLAKYEEMELALSIRSFDDVLTGAYVTALRFEPHQALVMKNLVIQRVIQGKYPDWFSTINSVSQQFNGIRLFVWTQEAYKEKSSTIILQLLNISQLETLIVPKLERPKETMTPSKAAVEEVEQLIKSGHVISKNWTALCDRIFTKEKYKNDEKFSIFSESTKRLLREHYETELDKISELDQIDMVR